MFTKMMVVLVVSINFISLNGTSVDASPWPKAGEAPIKAPPGDYPEKPNGWTVRQNGKSNPVELEWRDATGKFAIVSREYAIPLDSPFLTSPAFTKLPMEIQARLLESVVLYRAYLIKDDKYFELPTPLGYAFYQAQGYVEMWCKRLSLDMVEGVPTKGDKYHKPYEVGATALPDAAVPKQPAKASKSNTKKP